MSKITSPASPDWQSELNATAFKYHLLIARVGLVLNLVFGIGDYFNSPVHFKSFIIFRIVVSFLTLLVVLFKDKFVNRPEIIVLVPFLGIAIENAFIYSVLDGVEFQKHTLAFIALFIAGGMFILWKPIYSIIVFVATLIACIILFWMNSHMLLDEILINGGLLTFSVALLSILLIYSRTNLTKKEIISRLALAEVNNQLAVKNKIIEEKNKDITDSINYAERIQRALLASKNLLDENLSNYFILFKPKDIVSGDFYWAAKLSNGNFALVNADSTGHGVPGAIMSILNIACLKETVNQGITSPDLILNETRKLIIENLANDGSADGGKDGMDGSLMSFEFPSPSERDGRVRLHCSSANNPILIIRTSSPLFGRGGEVEIIEIKPDRMPIGKYEKEIIPFTLHTLNLQKGDLVYSFTDGYADQFGGASGKKFKYKKLQELLLANKNEPLEIQKQKLNDAFDVWKGDLEQVDDVTIIGIRI